MLNRGISIHAPILCFHYNIASIWFSPDHCAGRISSPMNRSLLRFHQVKWMVVKRRWFHSGWVIDSALLFLRSWFSSLLTRIKRWPFLPIESRWRSRWYVFLVLSDQNLRSPSLHHPQIRIVALQLPGASWLLACQICVLSLRVDSSCYIFNGALPVETSP